MQVSFEHDSILAALAALAKKDKKRRVFGSESHQYCLHTPLDEDTILAFEAEHRVKLPPDYRHFITEIGNGGAGPYYGLFKFGEHDDGFGFRSWDGGYLIGNFANPFPHEREWNLSDELLARRPDPDENTPEEEEDKLWEEWSRILEAEYWAGSVVDGAIPICHLGCAYRQWLVINGPQYSFIWNDNRADEGGLSPLLGPDKQLQTFTEWYLGWLNEALTKLKIK